MKGTFLALILVAAAFGSFEQAQACQAIASPAGCDFYLDNPLAHAQCVRKAAAQVQLGGVGTLANGTQFLLVGGVDSSGTKRDYTSKRAFIYDIQAKSLCETAPMLTGRNQGIPLQGLADGKVLVSGGWTSYGATKYAEIFDPASESWQKAGSLPVALYDHTTALQADGNVKVTGGLIPNKGRNSGATPNTDTFIFDTATLTFSTQ